MWKEYLKPNPSVQLIFVTSLREHCASVLLGNIKAGKWNVIKIQKLKAIKLHKSDGKKKESTPLREMPLHLWMFKSFRGFRK